MPWKSSVVTSTIVVTLNPIEAESAVAISFGGGPDNHRPMVEPTAPATSAKMKKDSPVPGRNVHGNLGRRLRSSHDLDMATYRINTATGRGHHARKLLDAPVDAASPT